MSKATLLELADRVEKASGPDRELDCLIFEWQHKLLTPDRRGTIDGEPTGQYFDLNDDLLPECAPHYTASLDAAMTLVPEGCIWDVASTGPAWVDVPGDSVLHSAKGETAATGLTAAALRARAQQESSDA